MADETHYLRYLRDLTDHRYTWLVNYLTNQPSFIERHIHPIRLSSLGDGFTSYLVADFLEDGRIVIRPTPMTTATPELAFPPRVEGVFGRVIVVSSTSGVDRFARYKQLNAKPRVTGPETSVPIRTPILTTSRIAGRPGGHPVKGHISRIPDPRLVQHVASYISANPEMLLRFLDQSQHLTYNNRTATHCNGGFVAEDGKHWRIYQACVDEGNHVLFAISQDSTNDPWTSKLE